MVSTTRVSRIGLYFPFSSDFSLRATIFSAYTLDFQTRLFSALPPSFNHAFKQLCAALLEPSNPDESPSKSWNVNSNSGIWKNFEFLGLLDRYENVIASVGYEFIEQHVKESCKGRWDKPILEDLRVWMSNRVVPWMLQVYARGASNRTSESLLSTVIMY